MMVANPTLRTVAVLILVAVFVALLLILYKFNPESYGCYPRCPLFMLTGLQCAGCGTARAAHALIHGNIPRAIAFNPILVVAVPLLLLLLLKPKWAYNRYVGWGVGVVVFGYSAWRNL